MTPDPSGATRPVSHRIVSEALYRAVVAAGRARSAHNAQPWRWRVSNDVLDLFINHDRMSRFTDPDGRLATISCRAALHHARVALAARGRRATVTRRPDAVNPGHLACLHIDGAAPVSPDTTSLARAIRVRPWTRGDRCKISSSHRLSVAHLLGLFTFTAYERLRRQSRLDDVGQGSSDARLVRIRQPDGPGLATWPGDVDLDDNSITHHLFDAAGRAGLRLGGWPWAAGSLCRAADLIGDGSVPLMIVRCTSMTGRCLRFSQPVHGGGARVDIAGSVFTLFKEAATGATTQDRYVTAVIE